MALTPALTRIRNNQVYNSDIYADAKVVAKSISGGLLSDNFTYTGNLTIGNLTVNGNTTTLDTTNVVIADPMFSINRNATGAPAYDLGIVMGRGSATNVAFIWEESSQQFQLQYTTQSTSATTFGVINNSGYANLQAYGVSLNNATIGSASVTTLNSSSTITSSGNIWAASGTATTNLSTGALVVTGGTGISGQLIVGSGIGLVGNATIYSNTAAVSLFNSVSTTLSAFQAVTSATIGATSGTFTIRNQTFLGSQSTQNLYNTIANTMNFASQATALNMGNIAGTANIASPYLIGSQTTQSLYDNVATTMNFAGAATTINMGATSGTLTINNPTVVGSQSTQNLYNTVATTLNVGGAATTINLAKADGTSAVKVNGTANSYGSGQGALQIAGGFYAAGDSYIAGNLVVGNITSTGYNQLIANAPLLYLTANAFSTYNYEIGFFSNKIDNAYEHTGLVRNHVDNNWYLFSNIGTEPGSTVDLANASIVFDTLLLGNMVAYSGNASTNTTTGAVVVRGGAGITGALNVGTGINLLGNAYITTDQSTATLFNGTSTTVNAFGAATIVTMGATSGTMNIQNPTIVGTQSTQNLFTANATSINFGSAATTINIGAGTGTSIFAHGIKTSNTVASTSTTTGALISAGGAGIAGDIYGGANTYIASTENVPSVYTSNIYPYANSGNINLYPQLNTNVTVNASKIVANLVVHGNGVAGWNNLLTTNGANGSVGIKTAPGEIVPNASLMITAVDSMIIPVGTTAQRPPNGTAGMVRFNNQSNNLEFYNPSTNDWTGTGSVFTIISDDQFTGDGSTLAFTMSQAGTTNSTLVFINGVAQLPLVAYSVSGTTLTFTEAPLSTDIIDARVTTTTSIATALSAGTSAFEVTDSGGSTGNIHGYVNGSEYRWIANAGVGGSNYLGNGISTLASNVTCSSNVPTVIDAFSTSAFRGAKYVVSVQDYNNYNFQMAEVIMVIGNANATIQTYGITTIGGTSFCNFYANVSGTTARLYANSSVTSVAKVQQIYMPK